MTHSALDAGAQRALMARAVSTGEIADTLNGLLPVHPQYRGLKRALAQTTRRATPPTAPSSAPISSAGAGCRAASGAATSS